MKKMITAAIAAAMIAMVGGIQAAGKKAEGKSAKSAKECAINGGCTKALNLTAAQKKQVSALKGACGEIGCKVSAGKKLASGMNKILTADQLTACKAACDKAGVKCLFAPTKDS
jgi:hypothetical protein